MMCSGDGRTLKMYFYMLNSEEKCDVTLPIVAKFLVLNRDGHLHCQTMKENYWLPFCS